MPFLNPVKYGFKILTAVLNIVHGARVGLGGYR